MCRPQQNALHSCHLQGSGATTDHPHSVNSADNSGVRPALWTFVLKLLLNDWSVWRLCSVDDRLINENPAPVSLCPPQIPVQNNLLLCLLFACCYASSTQQFVSQYTNVLSISLHVSANTIFIGLLQYEYTNVLILICFLYHCMSRRTRSSSDRYSTLTC
jgi:hypothetical protein